MSRPLVSVVLPTYNRVEGLRRVLTAFEGQRPHELPFEVVVVDDGSRDDTPELLAGWRSRRFPLRFARQTNQGPARARNRALELASDGSCSSAATTSSPTPTSSPSTWPSTPGAAIGERRCSA